MSHGFQDRAFVGGTNGEQVHASTSRREAGQRAEPDRDVRWRAIGHDTFQVIEAAEVPGKLHPRAGGTQAPQFDQPLFSGAKKITAAKPRLSAASE